MTDRPLCGARTRSGGSCRRPSGWGTDHPGWGSCKLHSGSTPNGQKAATRQQAEAQAAAWSRSNGGERVHPADALLTETARASAVVEWIQSRLGEDPTADDLWPVFGSERDRLARVARSALDTDAPGAAAFAEERSVRLVAEVVNAVLNSPALGLDAARKTEGRRLVRAGLAAVMDGRPLSEVQGLGVAELALN